MLIGPWALTTAGAAIVEAAPAAATFRKRRRVEVLSLVGVVMASSPFEPVLVGSAVICWLRLLRPARRFGNATLRCAPPAWAALAVPVASARQLWRSRQ